MKKLLLSLLTLCATSLLAQGGLQPEFSADANALKSEFAVQATKHVAKKKVEKKEKSSSFLSKFSLSGNSDEITIKVVSLKEVSAYTKTHKMITLTTSKTPVKKSDIEKKAKQVNAKKVLIYKDRTGRRFVYFFKK